MAMARLRAGLPIQRDRHRHRHGECAVWRRALQSEDVAALYTRGVLRLSLRVRVCQQPDCSDAPPFVGREGDSVPFVDPPQALAPPSPMALPTLSRGQYFQYEATFDVVAGDVDPELYRVTIRANR